MADPVLPVEAPTRTPRRGGIRDVAEFRGGVNRLAVGQNLVYTIQGCSLPSSDLALCYPSPAETQSEKTRDGIDEEGNVIPAFGLYTGRECWLDGEDYDAVVRRDLELGEDRGIEDAIQTWLTPITGSSAGTSVTEAIASAEDDADDNYIGAPVLLLNRMDAAVAFAEGAIERDDNGRLVTGNGTLVAASARFNSGQVVALGALTVLHTDIVVNNAPILVNNKEFSIAERVYSVLVDCGFNAKYTFTTP